VTLVRYFKENQTLSSNQRKKVNTMTKGSEVRTINPDQGNLRRFNSFRQVKFDLNLRPFIVIWEMTQACELSCRHCRASASPLRNLDELSTQEGKKLLDEIAQFGHPRPIVVLTGGDPLLRPDFFELISYSRNLGLATAVSPSGTPRLTFESLKKIKECGATSISLSLDGISEVHDNFRGVKGSYETTLTAAKISKALGLRLQLNTTVAKFNVEELPKLAILAHQLKVTTWSLFMLVPTGRGTNLEGLSAQQVEDVFHFCVDLASFLPVKVTEAPHYRRVVKMRQECYQKNLNWKDYLLHGKLYDKLSAEFMQLLEVKKISSFSKPEDSDLKRPPLVINAGNGLAFISYKGDVYPSGFLPVAAGNIRNSSLINIYQKSKVFQDLRDKSNLTGKCKICDYRDICGGSRSRSFSYNGTYVGDDPLCAYVPKVGNL
jgi:radical SAM protein